MVKGLVSIFKLVYNCDLKISSFILNYFISLISFCLFAGSSSITHGLWPLNGNYVTYVWKVPIPPKPYFLNAFVVIFYCAFSWILFGSSTMYSYNSFLSGVSNFFYRLISLFCLNIFISFMPFWFFSWSA